MVFHETVNNTQISSEITNLVHCVKCGENINKDFLSCPMCGSAQVKSNIDVNIPSPLTIHPNYSQGSGLCPYCNIRKGKIPRDGMKLCFECNKIAIDKIQNRTPNQLLTNNANNSTTNAPTQNNFTTFIIIFIGAIGTAFLLHMCGTCINTTPNFNANIEYNVTDNNYGIVYGIAKGINAKVTIKGINAPIKNGLYSVKVPLKMGINDLLVKYKDDSETHESNVNIERVTTNELKRRNEGSNNDSNNAIELAKSVRSSYVDKLREAHIADGGVLRFHIQGVNFKGPCQGAFCRGQ